MYLRLSLTERCNLRCTYCLPERAGFAPAACSTAELMRLASLVTAAAGVRKIRLTGGEPALCDDLVEHVRHARRLVPVVGMTSNGTLLEPLLPALREAGLQRLNLSLDAPDPAGFAAMARRPGFERTLAAIHAARRLGFAPLKVNCVATRATDLAGMLRFAVAAGVHLRFIELMAIGEGRALHPSGFIDAAAMRARLYEAGFSLRERRDRDDPTSRTWQVDGHAVEAVSAGFITTGSDPFCATCDRLRLTSRGTLHTCLFDEAGTPLLEALRDRGDAAVQDLVRRAVAAKRPPAHFVRAGAMAAIGG